jgi:hypothetical protein
MKNSYTTSILLLLLAFAFSNLTNGQIITDGTYKILNVVNTEVMSINTLPVGDPNNPDGLIIGRAQMAAPDSVDDMQLWSFTHQGNDVYKILNVGDNSILGIKDGWCGDFGDVQAGFDATSPYTLFKVTAAVDPNSYVFEIAFDADCNFGSSNTPIKSFDIDGGNSNGKIQTFPIDISNANQQFQIIDPSSLSLDNIDRSSNIYMVYHKIDRSVSVKNSENNSITNVRVFDMSGKLMVSHRDVLANEIKIEFNSFNNGLYFISIENKSTQLVEKVLIH